MATSPPQNYAGNTGSPHLPHLTIPTTSKRKSSDILPTSSPTVKRRKQSMLSTTSSIHPLRQTSFPPDDGDEGARYSPTSSVDNMSMVSGSTKAGKKSTGKRKVNHEDTSSLVSGNGRGLLSVTGRIGKEPSRGRSTGVEDEEDEEDANGMDLTVDESFTAYVKKGKDQLYAVRDALDPINQDRLDAWRASKFSTAMVKKLTNQTLSQSVPESVVFVIKIAAKLFAGDIIERARKVQEQWITTSAYTQLGQPKIPRLLALPSPPSDSEHSTQSQTEPGTSQQTHESSSETINGNNEALQKEKERKEDELQMQLNRENKGPLEPEHLIEAFRRYKEYDGLDRELLNISRANRATGAERFGIKNRKGRLFGGGRAIA